MKFSSCLPSLLACCSRLDELLVRTKVELKTHLCCGQCVAAVGKVLAGRGRQGRPAIEDAHVTITARMTRPLEGSRCLAAGFTGETNSKTVKAKDESGVTGKVEPYAHRRTRLLRTGNKRSAALKKVEGVKADTAKAKETSLK